MLGSGKAPVSYDLPLWELSDVLLDRRRVQFGGNDDDRLIGEEELWTLVVKVYEVV